MFLQLNVDGRNGSGTMFGITEVMLNHGAYHAWYRFDDDIERATINDQGQLELDVQIVERARIDRKGRLPKELKELEKEDPLPGGGRFLVTLEPDLQKPGVLKGTHSYAPGIRKRTKRLTSSTVMRARPYDAKRPTIEPQRVDGQHAASYRSSPSVATRRTKVTCDAVASKLVSQHLGHRRICSKSYAKRHRGRRSADFAAVETPAVDFS